VGQKKDVITPVFTGLGTGLRAPTHQRAESAQIELTQLAALSAGDQRPVWPKLPTVAGATQLLVSLTSLKGAVVGNVSEFMGVQIIFDTEEINATVTGTKGWCAPVGRSTR
jgi:hypothetical protein